MEATSAVYTYSPLQIKRIKKSSQFHRTHQSVVNYPLIVVFVQAAAMLLSFLGGGTLVYSVCSSSHHQNLEQANRTRISNVSSCSGVFNESFIVQCVHTIEAINSTISAATGKSKAHLLQLKDDIRREIARWQLRNESLVPHNRRRPPVETWNISVT